MDSDQMVFLTQSIQIAIREGMRDGFEATEKPIGLRDFFAGCALCGVLAAEAGFRKITFPDSGKRSQFCFDEADAMLRTRER